MFIIWIVASAGVYIFFIQLLSDDLKCKLEKREKQLRSFEGLLRNRDLRLAEILSERNDLLSKLEIAELTLRTLHDDHAKLVTELSGIKSNYPLKENYGDLIRKVCHNLIISISIYLIF